MNSSFGNVFYLYNPPPSDPTSCLRLSQTEVFSLLVLMFGANDVWSQHFFRVPFHPKRNGLMFQSRASSLPSYLFMECHMLKFKPHEAFHDQIKTRLCAVLLKRCEVK